MVFVVFGDLLVSGFGTKEFSAQSISVKSTFSDSGFPEGRFDSRHVGLTTVSKEGA